MKKTTPSARRRSSETAELPGDLVAALANHFEADTAFRALPPSHQREYVQWISEAKRAETRARRIAQTIRRVLAGSR